MAKAVINLQKESGGIVKISPVDGIGNTELILPESGIVATEAYVDANSSKSVSIPTAYHIYDGNLALADSVITNGFGTVLYTGNGTTQSINTGIDMATQWGDSADEKYGGLVWLKCRNVANVHQLFDTVRGVTKRVYTNGADAEATAATSLTSFNSNGFTIGADPGINTNLNTHASWNFQTTHRTSGVTNHGKPYTCHYNPFTGFTIVKYEGSGLAGHEIPHMLGRVPAFATFKNLTTTIDWVVGAAPMGMNNMLKLNTTDAQATTTTMWSSYPTDSIIALGTGTGVNTSAQQYILYGWANSYFDEDNTLIGNYEIGVYQGTGVAGNKVTTRGKPAWVMIKRLDSTGDWEILDINRGISNSGNDARLYANTSSVETNTVDTLNILSDGFSLNLNLNTSGGQYLYMVVYDNDSGSGKSKYPKPSDNPTLNLNAIVPLADGIDSNGSKTTLKVLNETVTGVTLTAGKNYIYRTNNGYGVKKYAPQYGKQPIDAWGIPNGEYISNTRHTSNTSKSGSIYAISEGVPAYYAVDSNFSDTGWHKATAYASGDWVEYSFSEKRKVQSISVSWLYTGVKALSIYYKTEDNNFILDGTLSVNVAQSGEMFIYNFLNNSNYIYGVKLVFTNYEGSTVTTLQNLVINTKIADFDFFNLITLKWYNSSNVEIEPRNYLDAIVHADHTGNATYVEQLPKTHYFDEVKANEYKGKNATSLSVAFNLSTTPVTIISDMVGVSSVIRTGTGVADIYLNDDVDGTRLKLNGITNGNEVKVSSIAQNKITVTTSNSSGTATSYTYTSINGVGE